MLEKEFFKKDAHVNKTIFNNWVKRGIAKPIALRLAKMATISYCNCRSTNGRRQKPVA